MYTWEVNPEGFEIGDWRKVEEIFLQNRYAFFFFFLVTNKKKALEVLDLYFHPLII